MSPVYVLLKKKVSQGVRVSTHEIVSEPPTLLGVKEEVITLQPDECIDVADCDVFTDKDGSEIRVQAYRVSNIDGQVKRELTEVYSLERFI